MLCDEERLRRCSARSLSSLLSLWAAGNYKKCVAGADSFMARTSARTNDLREHYSQFIGAHIVANNRSYKRLIVSHEADVVEVVNLQKLNRKVRTDTREHERQIDTHTHTSRLCATSKWRSTEKYIHHHRTRPASTLRINFNYSFGQQTLHGPAQNPAQMNYDECATRVRRSGIASHVHMRKSRKRVLSVEMRQSVREPVCCCCCSTMR